MRAFDWIVKHDYVVTAPAYLVLFDRFGFLAVALAAVAATATSVAEVERSWDRAERLYRRSGWRYGYGAGYVDATRGRPYDLEPPPDGRSRTGVDQ